MIKEFKQIEMQVGDTATFDFKKGVSKAKQLGVTRYTFVWGTNKRLDDTVFIERIGKVLPALTGKSIECFAFEPIEHGVIVSST